MDVEERQKEEEGLGTRMVTSQSDWPQVFLALRARRGRLGTRLVLKDFETLFKSERGWIIRYHLARLSRYFGPCLVFPCHIFYQKKRTTKLVGISSCTVVSRKQGRKFHNCTKNCHSTKNLKGQTLYKHVGFENSKWCTAKYKNIARNSGQEGDEYAL